jgi:IS5 family transposase
VNANKRAWNAAIGKVRGRIEKVFGTAKRSYGLARARYRGLARVALQIHFTFLAYNLRRAANLLRSAPA